MGVFREDIAAMLPRLRAFARSLARDRHLADDLVQDTLVSALRARHQFTPGTNLEAWLFTILRNRFRTVARRERAASRPPARTSARRGGAPPQAALVECSRSARPSAGSTRGSGRCWYSSASRV